MKPVFVACVQLEGFPHLKEPGTANQRNVVVVDDVKTLFQDPLQSAQVAQRSPGGVGQERGQWAQGTAQGVDEDLGMRLVSDFAGASSQNIKGVPAMHDLHVVALICEKVGQLLDQDGISAEGVGRIKCGDKAKSPRTLHKAGPALTGRKPEPWLSATLSTNSRCLPTGLRTIPARTPRQWREHHSF